VAQPTSQLNAVSRLRAAININSVLGGQNTNPLWTSEVGNAEFQEALRQSLAAHGMLAEEGGQYSLDAQLVEVDQPFVGFSMTVTTTVNYTLTEIATNRVVFQEVVMASPRTAASEAFLGVERLRIANENSIRENISMFIEMLRRSMDSPGRIPISRIEIGPINFGSG